MKKFIYFLSIVCLINVSCSTDSVNMEDSSSIYTIKNLTSTDLETAKSLYIDMMATQEYADFTNASDHFADKLLANKVSFGSKSEWMAWIQNNISSTAFSSIAEFESDLDEMAHKTDVLVTENTILFSFMKDANETEIGQILFPEHGTINFEPRTDCEEACYDECEQLIDMNIHIYNHDMADLTAIGGPLMNYKAGVVRRNYRKAHNNIISALNLCIYNCSL